MRDDLADYLASELTGASEFTTDWNNVLKLGYDVKALEYPVCGTNLGVGGTNRGVRGTVSGYPVLILESAVLVYSNLDTLHTDADARGY
eukprot:758866-Rhodomonas_salina.3